MNQPSRRILMLRGHSLGIGDLLRSSAAWRALVDAYGAGSQLHLAIFTKEPGYPAEPFIAQQALLQGVTVVSKAERGLAGWRKQLSRLDATLRSFQPDLIVDFEAHGTRTALLAAVLGWRHGIPTVGIAQFPGRGLFYSRSAPRARFKFPVGDRLREIDYTDRDFAVLAALGIQREGRPIEMSLTPAARAYGASLRQRLGLAEDVPLIGINIGCGTPDAHIKRPGAALLRALAQCAREATGGALLLTGAANERPINESFLREANLDADGPVFDLAGQTDLYELGGLIEQCRLFISSDSGPYHMAVALRVPTLALFNWPNHQAFHEDRWVRRVVRGPAGDDIPAACATLEAFLHDTAK